MTKKLVAMIPARLGSKRIPKKNLRYLLDKPLIQYVIELTKHSKRFDGVWVNSESEEIGAFATAQGVYFHQRPIELSSDQATNQQFTAEFLEKHECEYVVMINSTSPLLTQDTLERFVEFVNASDYDTIFTVIDEKAESFFRGEPINFDVNRKVNSQLLEPVQKIVWAMTAWKRETFLAYHFQNKCGTYAGNIGLFTIPKDESCDLDTMEDWAIAEGMLTARKMTERPVQFWERSDAVWN